MRTSRRQLLFHATLVLLILSLAGCMTAKPAVRSFDLQGTVKAVDRQARTATIEHGSIPGFMDAMTMAYEVRDDSAFASLKTGDTIHATLMSQGDKMWLEAVKVVPTPAQKP